MISVWSESEHVSSVVEVNFSNYFSSLHKYIRWIWRGSKWFSFFNNILQKILFYFAKRGIISQSSHMMGIFGQYQFVWQFKRGLLILAASVWSLCVGETPFHELFGILNFLFCFFFLGSLPSLQLNCDLWLLYGTFTPFGGWHVAFRCSLMWTRKLTLTLRTLNPSTSMSKSPVWLSCLLPSWLGVCYM